LLIYIILPSALNVSINALGDTKSNLLLKDFQETSLPLDKRFITFVLLDNTFLPLLETALWTDFTFTSLSGPSIKLNNFLIIKFLLLQVRL
jgi:hypothetical protein